MARVNGAGRIEMQGTEGRLSVSVWPHRAPARVVVLSHGYGEHIGRYEHVGAALLERGAGVCGPDHIGHGESDGERVVIGDFEHVVDDLHAVVERAGEEHPGVPVVLIGHSLGGLIATRYAQRHADQLAGLVISAPALGLGPVVSQWLAAPEVPADPIDPAVLSRDASVGEAYANDPLVWHGGWKRPTVEALQRVSEAIDAGPGFGDLPVLYIHGEADELVPMALVQPVAHRLAGSDFTEHIVPGARHEPFNELERDETIGVVAEFVERVTRR
jgi:alpha-beta hydrolase superfamily lysophospholipase